MAGKAQARSGRRHAQANVVWCAARRPGMGTPRLGAMAHPTQVHVGIHGRMASRPLAGGMAWFRHVPPGGKAEVATGYYIHRTGANGGLPTRRNVQQGRSSRLAQSSVVWLNGGTSEASARQTAKCAGWVIERSPNVGPVCVQPQQCVCVAKVCVVVARGSVGNNGVNLFHQHELVKRTGKCSV